MGFIRIPVFFPLQHKSVFVSYIEFFNTTIQVSSAVPEGKGVSSSASVEVASMSAIAAAHGNLLC